jgi:hypothetical protein
MSNEKAIAKYLSDNRHPVGKTDKGGRWFPDDSEECSCCQAIRSPSRAYPWSLWKHCKSSKHLLTLMKEKPDSMDEEVAIALKMTDKTAPLYINDSGLLNYIVKEVYGNNIRERKKVI